MIETDERPAYMYPDILSEHVYSKDEQPGIGRFLGQGAVVGVVPAFIAIANYMYSEPNDGYSFFIMFNLSLVLFNGMIFGAFEGSVVWACTRLVRRRLHFVVRGGIGIAVHIGVSTLMVVLLAERLIPKKGISPADYLWAIGLYTVFGLVFGLLVGSSRFDPWSELIRGTTTSREDSVATALTGIALRVLVTFGFMESVLNLIDQQQRDEVGSGHTMAVIAVIHFVAALLIVFVRMPRWLLLPFALLVNVPVVLFITDVLTTRDDPMWTISIIYLAAWFVFLVTRLTGMPQSRAESVTS